MHIFRTPTLYHTLLTQINSVQRIGFVSLGKLLSEHTSQVISLVSSIIMMVLVGGVVVATKASLPILVVMIAVAFGADFLFQSYSRETSKRFA